MDTYYELVLKEYDQHKGYDLYEINRCLEALQDYLYDIVEYDDDTMGGLMSDEIDWIVDDCRVMLHETLSGVPCVEPDTSNVDTTTASLERIEPYRGCDQQRTEEWYETRRGMITASIARAITRIDFITGKGIGVLRDKILPKPVVPIDVDESKYSKGFSPPSNPDAPTIRGIRYEPIIRRIYEHIHSVKVEEYDCVPHPVYPFIGASPDGIVVKGATRGRMVEIKCPQPSSILKDGNRVRPEYWSQMQLQMEVCDLETCDYVRVVVHEAPTLKEIQTLARSMRHQYLTGSIQPEVGKKDAEVVAAGTIWMDHTGSYHGTNPVDKKFRHEDLVHTQHEGEIMFIRHYIIFAKDWFTVTVRRNKEWFSKEFLPKAQLAWNEIQRGRKNPDTWQQKYPLQKRGNSKKETMTTHVIRSPETCLMIDD